MKQIVLTYGFIAGAIVSLLLVYTTFMYYHNNDFEGSIVLGYSSMFIAFSLIFIAVRQYRERYCNSVINFGKAFLTGLYITLLTATIYVVVWLICYYVFIPDFMTRYAAQTLSKAAAQGAGNTELAALRNEMNGYREMYKNPLLVVLLTYAEILPAGLLVSLLSALILKQTHKNGPSATIIT